MWLGNSTRSSKWLPMAEDPVDPVDPVDLLIDTLAYLTASEMVKKRVVNRI